MARCAPFSCCAAPKDPYFVVSVALLLFGAKRLGVYASLELWQSLIFTYLLPFSPIFTHLYLMLVDIEGVLHTVRARCMYWGAFVWLTTCSGMKCMCFPAVQVALSHILHCTVSPYSFPHVSFMASYWQHRHLHPIKC